MSTESYVDLNRVGHINAYILSGEREGYVEIINKDLEVHTVGDAIAEGTSDVEKVVEWINNGDIVLAKHRPIDRPDEEYVYCLNMEPYFIIKADI